MPNICSAVQNGTFLYMYL